MQKILRKRVLRDLRENILRYLALGFLIILGMYLVVSMIAAADTIIKGTGELAEEHNREDGEFSVFVPLSKQEEAALTEDGIQLEKMFYLDMSLEDGSTLRIYKNREEINLLTLDEGRQAENADEVVVEKRYAKEHGLSTGDRIEIGGTEYEITGIGTTPDYEAAFQEFSDSSVDSERFGTAFVTEEAYRALLKSGKSDKSEAYYYAYCLNGKMSNEDLRNKIKEFEFSAEEVEDSYFQEYWSETGGQKEKLKNSVNELADGSEKLNEGLIKLSESNETLQEGLGSIYDMYLTEYTAGVESAAEGAGKLAEGTAELEDKTNELLDKYFDVDISNLTMFLTAEDNPRIGAAGDDQVINKLGGLIAGVIVMILFTYVISVFVIHGIERECSVIGALYALGVKRKDLLRHYLMLPVLVTFAAGIIGFFLGISSIGVPVQMQDCFNYFSIPELNIIYAPYLVVYSVIMPPVVAAVVNYFVIRKHLSRTALSLIRNEQKDRKRRNLNLGNMGFVRRFQIRQMLREARTGFTVIFGMFISMLIMMLGLNCYALVTHISEETKEDTRFSYMYTYKYPEKIPPEDGEIAFAKTLKREAYGYNLEVTLLGITEGNPYFDAEVEAGENKVVLSSAAAQRYHLKEGDEIVLKDEEEGRDYAFEVTEVIQYSSGFYAFMDIGSMRTLFGETEDYYNVVFSDEELDIDAGRLYATTTRDNVYHSSDVFIDLMQPMIYTMCICSALIFAVVMYLMIKVMIDRSAFGISLVKIFGYRTKEIRRLYLNGNFYTVAVGAAICIPLSKWVMDMMYPYLISNVTCGMNLSFEWWMYVGIWLAVMVLYLFINQLLVLRLKKIVPAEVLKNRE